MLNLKKVIIVFGLILFWAGSVLADNNNLVVFFLPHQDDEMVLAGSIANYVEQGKEVKVVMMTDGGASEVRQELINEGYNYLTRTVFVARRNEEFFQTMLKLGVKQENILFANPGGKSGTKNPKYRDTRLSKEHALAVMNKFYKLWGEGVYVTTAGSADNSAYPHPDHEALELALKELPVKEKYFYTDHVDKGDVVSLPIDILEKKQRALDEYFVWEPQKRRFAIGARSVAERLQFWQNHPFEYRIKL